jgi:hypothetical protein
LFRRRALSQNGFAGFGIFGYSAQGDFQYLVAPGFAAFLAAAPAIAIAGNNVLAEFKVQQSP